MKEGECPRCMPQGLDLFGGSAPTVDEAIEAAAALAQDEDDRIVFLADLWLDRPTTLDRLRAVLEGAPYNAPLSLFRKATLGTGCPSLHTRAHSIVHMY